MLHIFKEQKPKKEPKNLKEALLEIQKLREEVKVLSSEMKRIEKMTVLSLHKVGLVRFNPFRDMGGDQSFSIALLDSNNNGFIITNLYSPKGTRVYAKPVKDGKSEYQLSSEEQEVITRATSSRISNS